MVSAPRDYSTEGLDLRGATNMYPLSLDTQFLK